MSNSPSSRLWILSPLLSLAACTPQTRSEGALVTETDLIALETKQNQINDKMFAFYAGLTERVTNLESRLSSLENLVKTYEVEIRRLNDKVDRLTSQGTSGPPTPPPATDPPATPRLEDQLKEIENQIARLKSGLRPEDIAKALLPLSAHAVPKLAEALKGALRDVELMRKLEFVLSKMPPSDLKVPMEAALKDGVARYPAARVIGEVGDRELSKILESSTSDSDLSFCYLVGNSLVRCKNRAGIPCLIRVLRCDDKDTRFLAISALRPLNGDNSFAYDFSKTPEQNAGPIKAWDDWYEKDGVKLFD